ncbi:OmpA family protein [Acuticoccus sediminis]|nr:OmpA family protein [Acuticoccus sediminis]
MTSLLAGPATAGGQDETSRIVPPEEIIAALSPKPTASTKTRGIKITGELPRTLPADHGLPSISLTISFEYDSHRLTNDGMLALRALGQALGDPRLKTMTFHIAGHTDSRGTDEYNQALSVRRADTVVEHLHAFYGIESERMISIGYGATRLADPSDPEGAANRRVEIVNLQPLS